MAITEESLQDVVTQSTEPQIDAEADAITVRWHGLPGCYVATVAGRDIAGTGANEEAAVLDLMAKLEG
jgi:hypothetical protein